MPDNSPKFNFYIKEKVKFIIIHKISLKIFLKYYGFSKNKKNVGIHLAHRKWGLFTVYSVCDH